MGDRNNCMLFYDETKIYQMNLGCRVEGAVWTDLITRKSFIVLCEKQHESNYHPTFHYYIFLLIRQ